MQAAVRNPEARRYLSEPDPLPRVEEEKRIWSHTFQFDVEGGKKFYLDIKDGQISVHDGDCGLDWQRKDWQQCSRIWTTAEVLQGVIEGVRDPIFEWHEGRWDFSSRIANSHLHSWFIILMRLAHEQLGRELVRQHVAAERSGV
jgi:hypothetical protein